MKTRQSMILFVIILVLLTGCATPATPTLPPLPTITSQPPTATTIPVTPTPAYGPSIHLIQGAGHVSPMSGKTVADVHGIITAVRSDGFYLQEPNPDNDNATSEGISVFTTSVMQVRIGDEVLVSGVVDEVIPGGATTANLSVTAIQLSKITKLSSGNTVPAPVVIGEGGRGLAVTENIDDDGLKNFEPDKDGIDFWETMESMLVQVNNAVVVAPTSKFKEIVLLPDTAKNGGLLTPRGGLLTRENDYNPERVMIDDLFLITPDVNVGDSFDKPIIGILDYTFGVYKIQITQRVGVIKGNLAPEAVASQAKANELSVATFNTENLDLSDGDAKFQKFAKVIVDNLKSPDLVSLEEIQDNSGPADNGITDASETYKTLIKAIEGNGGPKYEYVDIAPKSNEDGGETGGNIRVGFIYRTDRGLKLISRPGGDAIKPVEVKKGVSGAELSFSPGRVDPTNAAFLTSRKPLVAEFEFNGQKLFVMGLHLNSKGGDTPLMGKNQPPLLVSEIQRVQQAEIIQKFVAGLLSVDPKANIIIMGDINDFQFSKPVMKLKGSNLIDLITELPENERYTYAYEGNMQALDHIFISNSLKTYLSLNDVVHINSEFVFSKRTSDHDPVLARFIFSPK